MNLAPTDSLAVRLTGAVRAGALDELARLLDEQPDLVRARIAGRHGGWRTALHVATDWPGYFPNGPAVVRLLIEAGADPSAPGADGPSETPLHWAASSDDVELIDGGADIEAPGASIAGAGPLGNAVGYGYGCWHVARLLVERGARVDSLWQAAALGMTERVVELLGADPPHTQGQLDGAFWQACHGGQLRMAELLLARGADINAIPGYSTQAPLDIAGSTDTRRGQLFRWLRERGATSAKGPAPEQ
ncbi:MAG: ankyrin repeat domain-containing protein [Solirubrobacteraceae bacterium]